MTVMDEHSQSQDVITRALLTPFDPSKSMFDGIDESLDRPEATFQTQTVAKVFFQRTSHWLRWLEQKGEFVSKVDGRKVEPKRSENDIKQYSLRDIEQLAIILRENDAISTSRMFIALGLVRLVAIGYEMVPIV